MKTWFPINELRAGKSKQKMSRWECVVKNGGKSVKIRKSRIK